MNVCTLFPKITLKHCTLRINTSNLLYNFLETQWMWVKILNIQNIKVILESNAANEYTKSNISIEYIVQLYHLSVEAYSLYQFIIKSNMIYSLEEIHIRDQKFKFIYDLDLLFHKYCLKRNEEKIPIKIFVLNPKTNKEIEFKGIHLSNWIRKRKLSLLSQTSIVSFYF